MLLKNKIITEVLIVGCIIGIVLFVFNYFTLLYWHRDGFDSMEIALMTVLGGLYLFAFIFMINIYYLNRINRLYRDSNLSKIRPIYQVLITLPTALVVFLLLDSIFFLIDNSISVDYAESLKALAQRNGDELAGIEEFSKLPFGVQNAPIIFFTGLIGTFISLPFVKKDGELFKTKEF